MKKGFKSRKFLLSVAAFLASIGGSIGGIIADNKTLTIVGAVCTVLSAAIYAACEAYVDGKSAEIYAACEAYIDGKAVKQDK